MIRTLLVLLTVLTLAACGDSYTTEEYIQRATEELDKSQYVAASIELKNALRQDPNSAQARWLLGKAYLNINDMPSAIKELQQALDLGWPPDDIQPSMALALYAQGEFESVGELDAEGLTPDAQASLFGLKAQAALALGNNKEAEELIDKALALKPEAIEVLIAKARLLESKGNVKGALAIIDQVIAINPKQGDAWSMKGDIQTNQQKFKAALASYSKAIQLKRNNSSELFKRALLKMQMGDYKAAQVDSKALMSKAAKHPGSNYIRGLLQYEAGNYDEAIAAFSVTEPAFKQYPLSLFFLASANLKKGHLDLAINQAERFHKLSPGSVQGRKLLAMIRLQQRDFAAVQPLLEPVLANDPDDIDALNLASNALLQEGKTSEAIELLNRVAKLQPDSAEAKVRLGAGLLMDGKNEDALQPIKAALEMNPNIPMADMLLVLNYLQKKDYPAAIQAAQDYQKRNPDDVAPYNLLGRVYQEAGKSDEARKAFQGALALDPADQGANSYLAQLALAENDLAAARNYYKTILAAKPNSHQSLIQLASLDAREGQEKAMVDHLETAMAVAPAALEPRVILARYYLAKGKPAQVPPLFATLDAQQQQTPDVLRLMAISQLSTKDASAAQFSLEQLLKSAPDSAQIRHLMAMAAAEQGNSERMLEELHRSLELDKDYFPSRLALAKIALGTNDTAQFEQQIAVLAKEAPDNPEVLLMQAAAAQRAGDLATARKAAEKAFKLEPSSNALVSLATYEEMAGAREKALKRYAAWLEKHPDDVPVRMAYASGLMMDQQIPQSTTQYAIVLQANPENLTALNNQAWLLREKDTPKALEYARKAAELAPDSAAVLDTLAVVEYISKDYDQAQRNILRALKSAPDDPSIRYHSAMIAAALKDNATARATLEKLLAANPKFPEVAEAKALLATLKK
jgi:putative PEP-CTERM system TPR-repeat lipoprotein